MCRHSLLVDSQSLSSTTQNPCDWSDVLCIPGWQILSLSHQLTTGRFVCHLFAILCTLCFCEPNNTYLYIIYIVLGIISTIWRWFKVYGRVCIGYIQMLHYFKGRLKVSSRGPGTNPRRYWRPAVIKKKKKNRYSTVCPSRYCGITFINFCVRQHMEKHRLFRCYNVAQKYHV